jgi:hypothetical protein
MSESDDLTAAMTELANSELAFTNENTRDGKRIYIVDSVGLTEDELILSREACAHAGWDSSLFSGSRDLVDNALNAAHGAQAVVGPFRMLM